MVSAVAYYVWLSAFVIWFGCYVCFFFRNMLRNQNFELDLPEIFV